MPTHRRLLSAPFVLALVAGCCGSPTLYPDFAGVPDAKSRTAEAALPLDANGRAALLRRLIAAEGVAGDAKSEAEVADRYGPLLAVLASATTFEALRDEAGDLFRAAQHARRMRVNDAREDRVVLDVNHAFALVFGGFAWAIYQHPVNQPTAPMQLVVFPRQFVVTTGTR